MPTVSVDKKRLFEALGDASMTSEKFDELCFEFGIELDDETDDDPPQLKIDIPANRYDLLCFEGIAMNLNVFTKRIRLPNFVLKPPSGGQLEALTIKENTSHIRPYACGAILRNIKFTEDRYQSFIALQEKLHQNIARQRTLVAIGTHDLDTIKGPFTYDAVPPEQISFIPLNQTKQMNGSELMTFYEHDANLGKYLNIIRSSPVYPVILDADGIVLSLPPIINSNHSKIKVSTTNVFLELTATDRTKLEIVCNMMVTMFSQYCSEPFTIEPINVQSPHNSQSRQSPDLTPRPMQASAKYINSCCGLDLDTSTLCTNLTRMGYTARASQISPDALDIAVPPTRADVLHQADIMEDAAIAYGFNKLPRSFPTSTTQLFSAALPINKLADIVRVEAAMASWTEALSLVLCSHDENFKWLNRIDDGATVVKLQNPQTLENQVVRTSLLPGLLKCVRENKHHGGPIKMFEASDVAFKDDTKERKARNQRNFAAVWYDQSSGFEQVHGLLDKVMQRLNWMFRDLPEKEKTGDRVGEYWLELLVGQDDQKAVEGGVANGTYGNMFFPGRGVRVWVETREGGAKMELGCLGTLHPDVLKAFELPCPVSVLEINLEPLL